MKKTNPSSRILICLVILLSFLSTTIAQERQAQQILEATGVKGGLIVHIGCGDGQLTAALRASDRYLVHGLDSKADNVKRARRYVTSIGRYGEISIEHWNQSCLPYADNLVNLIVSEDLGAIPMSEVMRVLIPNGVAYIKDSNQWIKTIKPWPKDVDGWTHFLYDASNNAVSRDTVVGPPRHMQWIAGPRSARGHEGLGSVSVVVTANGRYFDIADDGPIASASLPPKWRLAARDAFNGVLLWKKPIPKWEWHLRPFRSGPPQLHRRLVAIGDTVYVTLGYGEALTSLDAATGHVIREYSETKGTEEIIYHDGVLYLVVGDPHDQSKVDMAVRKGETLPAVRRRVMAVRADNGNVLWKTRDSALPEIFPLTLAVNNGRVFYQTTEEIVSIQASSGEPIWSVARPAELKRRSWASPTLVVHSDVVFSADQALRQNADPTESPKPVAWDVTLAGGGKKGEIVALSAKTGEQLWSAPCQQTYNAPPDILITDGLLWTGNLVKAKESGITQALDLLTGQVERERPADQEFFNVGMGHHRCYRNRATDRYLVLGRSGVEFVDPKTGQAQAHHWVRGTCQLGVVPGNGLLYVPPHTCGCFIKAKVNGLNVLAPAGVSTGIGVAENRLKRGPAYNKISKVKSQISNDHDWPTYRHDATRSGKIQTPVSTDLKHCWKADIGGRLSSVVIAEGKVFIAQIDKHIIHAFDAGDGDAVWSFTAGGRVDSPPTIYKGRAIFGSADGWVYCLRARDGELVWRYRAAPGERRVVSYGQLESAWPVSGSVLVLDDVIYCAAGRSSYLDGGIRLCRIDVQTGELLSETLLSGYDQQTGKTIEAAVRVRGTEMPGALPDVLSSDGTFVFMRHLKFDREGVEQSEPTPHLFSSVGFLDDTWWHRTYWLWGTDVRSGWGGWWRVGNLVPAGRLLVLDDSLVYGFGRSFMPSGNAYQWRKGEAYHYFAAPKEFKIPKPPTSKKDRRRSKVGVDKSIVPFKWSKTADLEARAMIMAGSTLFVAGPLGQTYESINAYEGKEGIRLRAISVIDGRQLAEIKLDALPVFDGMAGARGRLYLSMKDGSLLCLADKE